MKKAVVERFGGSTVLAGTAYRQVCSRTPGTHGPSNERILITGSGCLDNFLRVTDGVMLVVLPCVPSRVECDAR
jgi:hypothetical protein